MKVVIYVMAALALSAASACGNDGFDVSRSSMLLFDRHDFDERGDAFLKPSEERTMSLLLSDARFDDEHWRAKSVDEQRRIEHELSYSNFVFLNRVPLDALSAGERVTLRRGENIVIQEAAIEKEFAGLETFELNIDDIEVRPLEGRLRGSIEVGEHSIAFDVSATRERVAKDNFFGIFRLAFLR